MPACLDRRDRLDDAIAKLAADGEFTAVVHRLGCIRGIATLTAFGLAVEIGDWHRLWQASWSDPRLPYEQSDCLTADHARR